jgi:hypothetical protein
MSISVTPFAGLLSSWDTWVFTALLVIALPCFAYFCLYRGAQRSGYFGKITKSGSYLWITCSLWFMLSLMAVVAIRHHISMADLGLHLQQPIRTITITAILLLVLAVMSLLDFRKHKGMSPEDLNWPISGIFSPQGSQKLSRFQPWRFPQEFAKNSSTGVGCYTSLAHPPIRSGSAFCLAA